ncbi:MAG: hypothetical protein H0X38_08200 [Planctomycetes bacterium]|nr:hypothetical protein [Planctomycetota bacterium]
MTAPTLTDVQIMIDTLFAKLDKAASGGELTRYQHALRIQISRKRSMGGTLTARERELVAAVGTITPARRGHPLLMLIVIIVLAAAALVLYRRFSPPAPGVPAALPAPPADGR